MDSTFRARVALLAVAASTGGALASAAEPSSVRFSASALNDSVHPGRGDSIDARSDTRSIRSVSVRYTRGVRGRVPRLDAPARAIAFTILSGPESAARVTGHLELPARAANRRVVLRSDDLPGLRVTFWPGSTPRLRVTGLPAETHRVELVTVGRAKDLLRNVGRCVDHVRRDTNVMDVTFADGSRRKVNRNSVACGF